VCVCVSALECEVIECFVGLDLVLISVLWSLVWHSARDWVRQGEHTCTHTNITHTHSLPPTYTHSCL